MSTGPWHYSEAERLTALATDADTPEYAAEYLQLAQVHATLALAAAVALPGQHPGDWEREIWAFGTEGEPDPEDVPEVTS